MQTLFYSIKTTPKLATGLPNLATTNVCKVNSILKNWIERSMVNELAHHWAIAQDASIHLNTVQNISIAIVTKNTKFNLYSLHYDKNTTYDLLWESLGHMSKEYFQYLLKSSGLVSFHVRNKFAAREQIIGIHILSICSTKGYTDLKNLKPWYSIGGFEWISINLSKSGAFSLQTLESNLKHP